MRASRHRRGASRSGYGPSTAGCAGSPLSTGCSCQPAITHVGKMRSRKTRPTGPLGLRSTSRPSVASAAMPAGAPRSNQGGRTRLAKQFTSQSEMPITTIPAMAHIGAKLGMPPRRRPAELRSMRRRRCPQASPSTTRETAVYQAQRCHDLHRHSQRGYERHVAGHYDPSEAIGDPRSGDGHGRVRCQPMSDQRHHRWHLGYQIVHQALHVVSLRGCDRRRGLPIRGHARCIPVSTRVR